MEYLSRIAAFTRYGDRAASTRQRLLQFAPALSADGMELAVHPLLDDQYMVSIARGITPSRAAVARAYARRLNNLSRWIDEADIVWIYAELFPYLPASFERLAARAGKPIVYDFDDAFFLSYELSGNPIVRRLLGGKFEPMLAQSSAVFCGNRYIADFAGQFARNSVFLPTVVDTDEYRVAPTRETDDIVVGWIGSPSTWRYVEPCIPTLRRVADRFCVTMHAVGAGAKAASLSKDFSRLRSIDWTHASEIADIQAMDIGIMPAINEPWALGKCGYKLIQYMACGLPVIASPVGAARDIVEHGVNGMLAETADEWESALGALIADAGLRSRMGAAGRARVEQQYSLRVHAPRLVAEMRTLAGGCPLERT